MNSEHSDNMRIEDALAGGPDTVVWRTGMDPAAATGKAPTPGTVDALLLGSQAGAIIEINSSNALRDIQAHVGDPLVDRMSFIPGLDIWVGDSSLHLAEFNPAASHFLLQLMRDAVSGAYAVDDAAARDDIAGLLASDDWAPVVFGNALVTGVNDAGDGVGALSSVFLEWMVKAWSV